MIDPTSNFPALSDKKVSAAFDGVRIMLNGGAMLLSEAERGLWIADRLDPMRIKNYLTDSKHNLSLKASSQRVVI